MSATNWLLVAIKGCVLSEVLPFLTRGGHIIVKVLLCHSAISVRVCGLDFDQLRRVVFVFGCILRVLQFAHVMNIEFKFSNALLLVDKTCPLCIP